MTAFQEAAAIESETPISAGAPRQLWEILKQLETDYAETVFDYAFLLTTLSLPANREALERDPELIQRLWPIIDHAKARFEARDRE